MHTNPDAHSFTTEGFEVDQRATLADKVYQQLFGWISNGQYARQTKLPSEHELARSFEVSRPVVRDALKRLRDDGVIYSRQGAGSFVLGPDAAESAAAAASDIAPLFTPAQTIADIQRCFEFRETIESETAALAACRRNQALLDELAAILRRLEHATTDHVHRDDIDLEFHLAIARAANNQYFTSALLALRDQISVGMKLHGMALLEPSGKLEQSTQEHAAILSAIQDRDPDRAREAMRLHIHNSRDRLFGGGLIDLSL